MNLCLGEDFIQDFEEVPSLNDVGCLQSWSEALVNEDLHEEVWRLWLNWSITVQLSAEVKDQLVCVLLDALHFDVNKCISEHRSHIVEFVEGVDYLREVEQRLGYELVSIGKHEDVFLQRSNLSIL